MKKLLLVFAALLLSSCIDVEDFGAYWDKTEIDPALAGHWKKVALTPKEDERHRGQSDELRFTEKDGAYEVEAYHKGKETDDPLYPVKVLKIAPYRFIVSGPRNGDLLRYEIAKNVLRIYVLHHAAALDFIRDNYPDAENIGNDDSEGESVKVKEFDDEAAEIIAAIPDTAIYWSYDSKYRKVP